jgi:hypothetical protein
MSFAVSETWPPSMEGTDFDLRNEQVSEAENFTLVFTDPANATVSLLHVVKRA